MFGCGRVDIRGYICWTASMATDFEDTTEELDLVYEAPLGIQQVDIDAPTPSGLDKIVSQEDDGPSANDSSRGASLSTTEHLSDAASVHSMPAVLVTEPDSALARRASTLQPTTDMPPRPPPASPTRPNAESALNPQDRRNRHRSAVEVRRHPVLASQCTETHPV